MMAFGLGAAGLLVHGRTRWALWAGAVVVGQGVAPAILIAAGAWVIRRLLHLRRRRHAARRAEAGVADLADFVGLALTAGLNVQGSLVAARPHVAPELAAELDAVVRAARHRGIASALNDGRGPAASLYAALARAVAGGTSALAVVDAFSVERRAALHTASIEQTRRLPVKLLFPLALLVLPGFVLVVVGPVVVTALDRLGL